MTFPFPYIARYSRNEFWGGEASFPSLYDMMNFMASKGNDMDVPEAGGNLIINGQSLGAYDFVIKQGNQQISSFDAAKWFTNNEDTHAAIVIVKGDLTIDEGEIFIPPVRKLILGIYCTGDLILDGDISMTARGADHSAATGSNIPPVDIRLAVGTFSGVTDPQIPALGGNGGPATTGRGNGEPGEDGSDGGTGGGGGGGQGTDRDDDPPDGETSGAGAQGTCFGGGPGGGGAYNEQGDAHAEDGNIHGGKGGDGDSGTDDGNSGGGAGNPGGQPDNSGSAGEDGIGGTIFYTVVGTVFGTGVVQSHGSEGGFGSSALFSGSAYGGGSGAGSITGLVGSDEGISPSALGQGPASLRGGNGSVRVLEF